jgi:hypothetical protein
MPDFGNRLSIRNTFESPRREKNAYITLYALPNQLRSRCSAAKNS